MRALQSNTLILTLLRRRARRLTNDGNIFDAWITFCTDMKSYNVCLMVVFSITLNNPQPRFQGHAIIRR